MFDIVSLECKKERSFVGLFYDHFSDNAWERLQNNYIKIYMIFFDPEKKDFIIRSFNKNDAYYEMVPSLYRELKDIDSGQQFEKTKDRKDFQKYLESIGIFDYRKVKPFINNYRVLKDNELIAKYSDYIKRQKEQVECLEESSSLMEEIINNNANNNAKRKILNIFKKKSN